MAILSTEKEALNRAFKALRSQGYIARQSYGHCCSCAGSQLTSDVQKMSEAKREKLKGAVYYHSQDTDCMLECQELQIKYGPVEIDGKEHGKPSEEIAADIVRALEAEGIPTVWDGNTFTCVAAYFTGAKSPVTIRLERRMAESAA